VTTEADRVTSAHSDRYQWVEPGAYPVAGGVYRIPTVLPMDGLRAVNIYVLTAPDGLTLIDGGWALDAARQALADGLKLIGAGLGDIRRFLVTHAHRDHYTNAIAVRREYGTTVLLGAGERPTIERLLTPGPAARAQFDQLLRHGGAPIAEALEKLGPPPGAQDYEWPDEWIADGQRFEVGDRVVEAISTPGHTRGHVVFADRAAGLLFAGDHVLPHITPSIAFEAAPSPTGLTDYLASLRLVLALPDLTLLPAHGPAGGRLHARVEELLAHHDHRLDEMAATLTRDGATAYEIAGQIPWTSRQRKLTDLDPVNQMLAVLETALHLELLADRGRATATDSAGPQQLRGSTAGAGPWQRRAPAQQLRLFAAVPRLGGEGLVS
jgi:glyoxylase-like metal-dependent hydrolase (beta-lactamase superfamily II)